jgi:hypothetical protein
MSGMKMPGIFIYSSCKSGRLTGYGLYSNALEAGDSGYKNVRQKVTPDGTRLVTTAPCLRQAGKRVVGKII